MYIIGIDSEFMNNNTYTSKIFAIAAVVFEIDNLDLITYDTELNPIDQILLTTNVTEPINSNTESWWKSEKNINVLNQLLDTKVNSTFYADHDEFVNKFYSWYKPYAVNNTILVSDEIISDIGRISIEIEEMLYRVTGENKISSGLRFNGDEYVVNIIDISTYRNAYFAIRENKPSFFIDLPYEYKKELETYRQKLTAAPLLVVAEHDHNPLNDTLNMMGNFFALCVETAK